MIDPFMDIYASRGWLKDYDPARPFPFFINLELSNRCQLEWLFCSRQLSKRPLGDLSLSPAEAILREAVKREGIAIRFSGWGEPLLHPKVREIVKLAKDHLLRIKLYTNVLLLDSALLEAFIELGLDEIQFYFQGLNKEQYLFHRRKSDYELLTNNITSAAKVKGERKRPFFQPPHERFGKRA
jgi:MoaA/NifB/PqqE/SkfB family radical SAM enzyme